MVELAALIIVGGFAIACAKWIFVICFWIIFEICKEIGDVIKYINSKFPKKESKKKIETPKIVEVKKHQSNIEFDEELEEECDPIFSTSYFGYTPPSRSSRVH